VGWVNKSSWTKKKIKFEIPFMKLKVQHQRERLKWAGIPINN